MLIATDTNVLGYAEGGDDLRKSDIARLWLSGFEGDLILPSQVAGELYNVLTRKFRRSKSAAAARIRGWRELSIFQTATPEDFDDALSLASEHNFQIWDALIVVTAASAGCRLLLSEDMQDGFVYRGVTVANPFAETLHPLLASVLATLPDPGADK